MTTSLPPSSPASLSSAKKGAVTLPFTKMQGLGNDYIYIEEFGAPLDDPASLAVRISDRHFGVGGDGLVLIGPSQRADFRMRIFNADGSEAEMCGNATRCVGKYLFERGFTAKRDITLETLAGIRALRLEGDGPNVAAVRVNMGKPSLIPVDLPMLIDDDSFIHREIAIDNRVYRATAVSMGNPHLVVPFHGIDSLDLPRIGPLFERHPLFPKGVNTEFIEVRSHNRIRMRVWERGSGETLACGTGACAALVACSLNGFTERSATVELPGGELAVSWDAEGVVHMTGGANFVFSGEYRL
jgi:diaminopimelate epimerase